MIRSRVHNFEEQIAAAISRAGPIAFDGSPTPTTGSLTPSTGGTAYAFQVGIAPRQMSAIDAFFYVHGVAAVGTGWAEVAIATSDPLAHANYDASPEAINLTYRGYADIETEVKVAATVGYWKRIVPTTPILAGSPLWVVVCGLFATTQASYRTFNDAVVIGDAKTKADATGATTRPSTNIGTALSFSGNVGTAVACPFLRARYLG